MTGFQSRTYGAVPRHDPLSPYCKLEDPVITKLKFYFPVIQLLDDFQWSFKISQPQVWV